MPYKVLNLSPADGKTYDAAATTINAIVYAQSDYHRYYMKTGAGLSYTTVDDLTADNLKIETSTDLGYVLTSQMGMKFHFGLDLDFAFRFTAYATTWEIRPRLYFTELKQPSRYSWDVHPSDQTSKPIMKIDSKSFSAASLTSTSDPLKTTLSNFNRVPLSY